MWSRQHQFTRVPRLGQDVVVVRHLKAVLCLLAVPRASSLLRPGFRWQTSNSHPSSGQSIATTVRHRSQQGRLRALAHRSRTLTSRFWRFIEFSPQIGFLSNHIVNKYMAHGLLQTLLSVVCSRASKLQFCTFCPTELSVEWTPHPRRMGNFSASWPRMLRALGCSPQIPSLLGWGVVMSAHTRLVYIILMS